MSISKNQVTLIGTVGKDPEVTYHSNGSVIAKFSIATEKSWKDKTGAWQKKTTWVSTQCWGTLAQLVEKEVHKGMNLSIEGHIANDSWEDAQGVKKYSTYVQIETVAVIAPLAKNGKDNDLSRM
jgi:single-strand DNA-binding protein